MQFNSFLFILCFLPLVLLGYFTLGRVHPVWSKFVLIGASLFFYAYAEPRTLLPLGLSLLVNYIFSKLLESEKLCWRRFSWQYRSASMLRCCSILSTSTLQSPITMHCSIQTMP